MTPPRRDTVGDVLLWAMLASLAGFIILFLISIFSIFVISPR